ncbi:MAG: glutamine--fructose-6-phosphate transaminase (isomerizing) [Coriobacteriia bacterium]|jgi:glucosamine--fructose-6-phosphate aminotransferase (isomerizing)
MCGIIGYVGNKQAAPILLDGLRRLEYRGYDSAGVAILDGALQVRKRKGRIDEGIARAVAADPVEGLTGIAHTRWATHGAPSDENSHPHLDASGRIAVVHNGVIENYEPLKEGLLNQGHEFASSTDTEVLAHLIGVHYERLSAGDVSPDTLTKAVIAALDEVSGTYGIAVICSDVPGVIVGARQGSPLIIGIGKGENFLTSDATAVVTHTREVIFLNDHDVVTLTADSFEVENTGAKAADVKISSLEFEAEDSQRGDFEHFMLKEIFEQPRAVENAFRGRIDHDAADAVLGGLNMTPGELRGVQRVIIVASGTSRHAALVGEYLIEALSHIPVEVEFAHEFSYRMAPVRRDTLILAISQSGETADTLMALREARRRGHKALGIVNVVGSTIARESDGGVYMRSGPEIGVASTKAYVATITILTLLAVHMGRMRMLSAAQAEQTLKALEAVPAQIETLLAQSDAIKALAQKYADAEHFFFLGRGYSYPTALEGALKLKEISYIHAEGYSAAEMKHGPIALIDETTPCVFLVPQDPMYEKTMANLEMIRARKGPIIAIATEGDEQVRSAAEDVIYLPKTRDELNPLLAVVPLQLLSYHLACARGCDVDKPRNLAKSVTVQ